MGSTRGRTRTLEAARRVAHVWNGVDDMGRRWVSEQVSPELRTELDTLLESVSAASEEQHRTNPRTITGRGRAENGYQPEREYVWSCSCRPGEQSGDMGGSGWAKQAADKHRADPTQFPGWLE